MSIGLADKETAVSLTQKFSWGQLLHSAFQQKKIVSSCIIKIVGYFQVHGSQDNMGYQLQIPGNIYSRQPVGDVYNLVTWSQGKPLVASGIQVLAHMFCLQ